MGSVTVNQAIRNILPEILNVFQVIHICGKGNLDESLIGTKGYVQYEYVDKPLRHLFAAADLVISRAGANSICEILALRKPNILIAFRFGKPRRSDFECKFLCKAGI